MKRNLLYTICFVALAITVLPIAANDYLKIYFKDGHTERHFMHLVESISTTNCDLEGNLHSNHVMQQIVMKDTTYSYYLADIDSMAFTKVDEEQVKSRVESVQSSLEPIFQQCSNVEDITSFVDEIKNIDGVEDVYYDGADVFLKIRDWFDVIISHQPQPDDIGSFVDSSNKQNIKRLKPTTEDGSPMKVSIGFQMKDDYNFVDGKVAINLLNTKFSVMGYDSEFLLGDELDFNYFYKKIFDNNVLLIDTHGGCGILNKKHYLYTGIKVKYAWAQLVGLAELRALGIDVNNIDLDDIGISLCSYDDGDLWDSEIGSKWYWIVKEDFIRKSPYRFTGAGPHIVFVAACSSLEGDDVLTRSDDVHPYGNDSFAQVFFDKGADVYLGYNRGTYRSTGAAVSFFNNMLHGASVEQAFKSLNPLFKYEEDKDEKALLVDLYNHNSKNPKGLFIVNTHTINKTDQEFSSEYKKSGQLELIGKTDKYSSDFGVNIFGFRIATEPKVDELTDFQTLYSTNANPSDANFRELTFSAMFTPEVNKKYYYRAFTYDGIHYNWGEERSFIIEEPTEVPAEAIDLGLPSGTLWASCNVGASKPEEYGGYYAWGETEEKDVYNESTYKYCNNGIYANIGNDIGGTEYDVAHVKWGGNWRIPNKRMMKELYENCSTKWTTQNGVYGELFTGPNGNTLFLPAAGYRKEDQHLYPGVWGDYVSSSISEANTYSFYELYFKSGLIKCDYVYNDNPTYRKYGHTVRPVIPGLELSSNGPLNILEGKSETVSIRYGNGSYRYEVDKEGIVSVSIIGSKIVIKAEEVGEAIVTVIDNNGGKANISVKVCAVPEAKDLGLPSGTKWASFNIGANQPEEYGDYYAWGESGVKDAYSESTYDYCKNGIYTNIGKDIRGAEYDTARKKWGGEWTMPSTIQFNELIANCTSEWTTLNGVKGRKFTSKINGEYVFFPAAGYHDSKVNNSGSNGYYWSSDLNLENEGKASNLSVKNGTPGIANNSRYFGFSVRPVIPGLELSATGTLNIFVGNSNTITIKSGSGSYRYNVDKEGIVSARIIGSTVTINALQIGDVVFSVTDMIGGQKAYITINVKAVPKAIDLGLPSGTKWANVNVGANNPEDFGDYYAWGETEPKSVYTTSTYQHYKNSSYVDIGYDIRGTEYDAAHTKWGGNWKMPSSTQIKELIANCISEWTTVNGVNGCKFISKINGDSIFLPAMGYCENGVSNSGTAGYYWACDKVIDKNNGYNLRVKNDGSSLNAYGRYYGFAVRPVIREKSEEDDPRMDEVVPEIIRDKFRDHMPIYSGMNPPNIEGSYLIKPCTVVYCEDGRWNPGEVIDSYKIKFHNQSPIDKTIDMIKYRVEDKSEYNIGTGAFISGDGTHFTAYFMTEGMSQNIRTKESFVVSGTKTDNGIEDLYYGFVMVEKGSDPDNKLMKTGVFRAFKDGDGISKPTTWEFSNVKQMKPMDKHKSETMKEGSVQGENSQFENSSSVEDKDTGSWTIQIEEPNVSGHF